MLTMHFVCCGICCIVSIAGLFLKIPNMMEGEKQVAIEQHLPSIFKGTENIKLMDTEMC